MPIGNAFEYYQLPHKTFYIIPIGGCDVFIKLRCEGSCIDIIEYSGLMFVRETLGYWNSNITTDSDSDSLGCTNIDYMIIGHASVGNGTLPTDQTSDTRQRLIVTIIHYHYGMAYIALGYGRSCISGIGTMASHNWKCNNSIIVHLSTGRKQATDYNGHEARHVPYSRLGDNEYFDDRVIITTNSIRSVNVNTIGYDKSAISTGSAIESTSIGITMIGSITQHDNSYGSEINASANPINTIIGNDNDNDMQLLGNISDVTSADITIMIYMPVSRADTVCNTIQTLRILIPDTNH